MDIKCCDVCERKVTLYCSDIEDSPLIVLNNFSGDGKNVVMELEKLTTKDFNLLCVGELNWDHDMTPWYAPPLTKDDTPCTGGADDYLKLLVSEIVPDAVAKIKGYPKYIGIAGYSLAGLFAVYAMYNCDIFDRAASMSGSFWFPDFKEYVFDHSMKKKPDKLYLSLGDKEAMTKNPVLKTVRENTEQICQHLREQGIDVDWELNPGNHFKNAAIRSAKGIAAIL